MTEREKARIRVMRHAKKLAKDAGVHHAPTTIDTLGDAIRQLVQVIQGHMPRTLEDDA